MGRLPGSQGSGSARCSGGGGWGGRQWSAADGAAAGIGPCAPVSCLESASLTEEPGRPHPQGHRGGHERMALRAWAEGFFAGGRPAPVRAPHGGGAATRLAGTLLGAGTGRPPPQESWRSQRRSEPLVRGVVMEGLFGRSFSGAGHSGS